MTGPRTDPHESLVLSAHTVSVLARHVAGRLDTDPTAQAFVIALVDAAALAEAWVAAQIDALDTTPRPAAAPQVAPPVAPTPTTPATNPQPLTATAAVLAATTQLTEGATARDIAQHIAAHHQLDVTPGSVRAILSKHRREQGATKPATPFGFAPGGQP